MNEFIESMLIIDDKGLMTIFLKEVFTNEGHTKVMTTTSGEEGLELCTAVKLQIIITDFQMPLMSGGKFIQELRLNPGLNKNTPIVLLKCKKPYHIHKFFEFDKVFYHLKPMRINSVTQLIMEAIK